MARRYGGDTFFQGDLNVSVASAPTGLLQAAGVASSTFTGGFSFGTSKRRIKYEYAMSGTTCQWEGAKGFGYCQKATFFRELASFPLLS